jgi:formylglycine-generating enzyme required for sulfatase activity
MPTKPLCCLASVLALLAVCGLLCLLFAPAAAAPTPFDNLPQVEPATHRAYTQAIPGSKVRFDLVPIPGGSFRMGSPAGEAGRKPDEGPPHPVKVRPFWMGKCEVTWDEFDLYRAGGPGSEIENEKALEKDVDAITRPTQPYPDETRGYGRAGRPALSPSHHAAMEYCRWLSLKTCKRYRLPTEAEWEWAARAGTRTAYFFGDDPKKLGEYAWFSGNSLEQPHPVGQKKPNPWGLHDIYGNVSEWCLDQYHRDYHAGFPARRLTLAPVKLPTADRYSRAVRGGSWDDPAARCRSAARLGSDPSWNKMDPMKPKGLWWEWDAEQVGFRVVRAVDEDDALARVRSKVTRKSK